MRGDFVPVRQWVAPGRDTRVSKGLRRASFLARPSAIASSFAEPQVTTQEPIRHQFADDGVFPNSRLPVVIYRGVFAATSTPAFEELFAAHGWSSAWRNGLYSVHHYHSTAHEVLGIFQGWVSARLGGPRGQLVRLNRGDVLVIPAGVAHKNEGASADFRVVGAYPDGTGPDMQYGRPGERPATDRKIAAVPSPGADPVHGRDGAIARLWKPTI
jgi:uncharacterized protein YjlB